MGWRLSSMAAAAVMAVALGWTPCARAQDDSYGQDSGYGTGPAAPAPGEVAEQSSGGDTLSQVGWGALAVVSNLVYVPAKLVYAGLGGLTGSMALGLTGGDLSTAQQIWEPALGGDYFLTPGMLQGEEAVSFAGAPAELTGQTPPAQAPGEEPAPTDSGEPHYGS